MSSSTPSSKKKSTKVTVKTSTTDGSGGQLEQSPDTAAEPQADQDVATATTEPKDKVKVAVATDDDGEIAYSEDGSEAQVPDAIELAVGASAELAEAVEAFVTAEPDPEHLDEFVPRQRQPKVSPRDRGPRPNLAPWITTALAVVAAAGLAASALPLASSAARSQASRLVRAGEQGSGHTAELDFRLANVLDAGNQTAALHLAALQLAAGQPGKAHETIARTTKLGQGSDLLVVDAEALLELGRPSEAAAAARTVAWVTTDQNQLATAAVVLAAAGQGSEVSALSSRVTAPEAAKRVLRARSGNIALAQELASSGLLESSSAILTKLPSTAPRDLLLAQIKASSRDKAQRQQAADLYRSYLANVPTDIGTRLSYASLLDGLGRASESAAQRSLAASLTAGRP